MVHLPPTQCLQPQMCTRGEAPFLVGDREVRLLRRAVIGSRSQPRHPCPIGMAAFGERSGPPCSEQFWALRPGDVFFERVGVLQASEFNGKSTLNTAHNAALNFSEHHQRSHLGLGIAGNRRP